MEMLIAIVFAAALQSGKDALLVQLEGKWHGTGTVLGQPSKIEMEWSWQLDGQFIRLTFHNTLGSAPKARIFEGHAYYRAVGDGQLSRNVVRQFRACSGPSRPAGNATRWSSKWGTPETEQGETTYRLLPDDGRWK